MLDPIPIIFVSVLFVVALLIYLFDFGKFKENFSKRPPKITVLPIVTPSGHIVSSADDLDMHVEFLKNQLDEKEKELDQSKNKMACVEENLKRLTDTTNEVKKYYQKLKNEITKVDNECTQLTCQIEDYKTRQSRLREEVNENVKYYTDLLSNIDGTTNNTNEDYEVVSRPLLGI